MAKQRTEDELNIRRKARRRLIGAVALALAVVVILPMVLDSEPKPTGQDIDLRIPAPDKAGEFVPGVALSEVQEVTAESAVLADTAAVSGVPAPEPSIKLPAAAPGVASGHLVSDTVRQEVRAPVAASKPPEVSKPEVRQPEAKSVEKAVGTYVVQVGAFSNAATASQEADKLKAQGFKAYTELISGTTRVRVGPYVDRKKADEVRQLLEKHGLHPAITTIK